ncbi:hypothetical protein AXG93_1390s1100 [Marchantia polymorpha subsp. ruderalis]|uniref:F-box domain-containing protein n=1 Tax=Marchantia polymorpha subsp. ruderalis TaxID=1480154 RepID=A0A176W7T9_MARPO|nr:hypothetical protein AXG93_1390s1100 [Marchantia polymorpha subsp. ruderalis]
MPSPRGIWDLLDDDTIIYILKYLVAPSDVANASVVSRSWRQHVLEGQLWRGLCHREFPELGLIDDVIEIDILRRVEGAGSSNTSYQSTLEKNHRVYRQLYWEMTQTPLLERNCISAAIAASSTDKFPEESIHETLHPNSKRPRDIHDSSWSYWSSTGQKDPRVPESLTYKLLSSLCLVHEIKIRPFEAEFQHGNPVYSSKYVRFRLGYENPRRPSCSDDMLKMDVECDKPLEFPWTPGPPPEYIWTYVSPEYPMDQRDSLQTFKLPRPVLCMGQILQVELLERVQTQLQDLLYYICVCHVRVIGKPIKNFGFSPLSAGGGGCGLICQRGLDYLATPKPDIPEHVPNEDDAAGAALGAGRDNFAERIRQLRLNRGLFHNTYVLNRILGNLAVASLLLATEDYITDADDEDEMSEEDLDEDDDFQDDDEPGYLF